MCSADCGEWKRRHESEWTRRLKWPEELLETGEHLTAYRAAHRVLVYPAQAVDSARQKPTNSCQSFSGLSLSLSPGLVSLPRDPLQQPRCPMLWLLMYSVYYGESSTDGARDKKKRRTGSEQQRHNTVFASLFRSRARGRSSISARVGPAG